MRRAQTVSEGGSGASRGRTRLLEGMLLAVAVGLGSILVSSATLAEGTAPQTSSWIRPYPEYRSYLATRYEQHGEDCIRRLGWEQACASLLETADSLRPGQVSTRFLLARFYMMTGDLPRAHGSLAAVLQTDPTQLEALRLLGDVYSLQGMLRQATEKYEQYRTAQPGDPLVWYGLAAVAVQNGHDDDALRLLGEAVKRGFNEPDALQADSRWKRLAQDPRVIALLEAP